MQKSPFLPDSPLEKKAGTAPYKTREQLEKSLRAEAEKNPNGFVGVIERERAKMREENVQETASTLMNRLRNLEFQQKWYKGEEPTTAEFYSAIRKAAEKDPEKAKSIELGFTAWQNDPTSRYYEPYLYKMTNTAAAQGIYELTGVDITGGVTQGDIDELKKLADYSNVGVGGTPLSSGTPAQQLAYWTYQLEKDEAITQQAEKEMEWLTLDIQALVDKGFSDEYIAGKLDMSQYPTLKTMQETASLGAVTPLNRPIGYSNDYVFGAIWASRNGGSTGNSITDIANWHDKVGISYVPDAKKEAARNPASDNYHPYSYGATLDFVDRGSLPESGKYDRKWVTENKDMLNGTSEEAAQYRKIRNAVETTEEAARELEKLKAETNRMFSSGKTPDEVYAHLTKNSLEALAEDYPTLAKMEFARQEGMYIPLTDTVDFALPYFKEWMDEAYTWKTDGHKETEVPLVSDVDYRAGGGGTKAPVRRAPVKPVFTEDAEKEEEREAKEEKAAETPVQAENTRKDEPTVIPTENFTMNGFLEVNPFGSNEYSFLWSALDDYRRGVGTDDPDALAFIEKYPYLFGGEETHTTYATGGKVINRDIDTRQYKYDGIVKKPNELGETASELLKQADNAQSAGYYSRYSYINLLMSLAAEVDNAKANNTTLEALMTTEGTSANELLKYTAQEMDVAQRNYEASRKQERVDMATVAFSFREAWQNGTFEELYVLSGDAQTGEASDNRFVWTEQERDMWAHLVQESFETVVGSNEMHLYDPKGYYTKSYDIATDTVLEELSYVDEYNALPEGINGQMSVVSLITNRVHTQLMNDLGLAKAAGVSFDEIMNAQGYADLTTVEGRQSGYAGLDKYVGGLVEKEIEAFKRMDAAVANEMTDAVYWMEAFEESEDDENRYDFTEEEIQGAIEYGYIDERQADLVRMYSEVNKNTGGSTNVSLDTWEMYGGVDAIRSAMYNYLAEVSSTEKMERARGEQPETSIVFEGNREDGRASAGYVLKKSGEVAVKQLSKSWIETYYSLIRQDSSEREKRYRAEYTREEVRQNIEDTMNDIPDGELKYNLLKQLEMFEGDIYDFDFDFEAEDVLNAARRLEHNLELVRKDIAENCTAMQAATIQHLSGAIENAISIPADIAVTYLAAKSGVPVMWSKFIGTYLTSGLRQQGETTNALMDAGVSKRWALVSGVLSGSTMTGLEMALDPFVGMNASLTKGTLKSFTKQAGAHVTDVASEGFLRTAMKTAVNGGRSATTALKNATAKVGGYLADKATDVVQEEITEASQAFATDVIENAALAASDKQHEIEWTTWDEYEQLMGDTAIQTLILGAGLDTVSFPGKKYSRYKELTKAASALAMSEKVTALQVEQTAQALRDAMEERDFASYVAEAATQAQIEEIAITETANRAEEIQQSAAHKTLVQTEQDFIEAEREAEENLLAKEAAEQAFNEAVIPFEQEGTIPTEEQIQARDEAEKAVQIADEKLNQSLDKMLEKQGEYETAKENAQAETNAVLEQEREKARIQLVEERRNREIQEAQREMEEAQKRAERLKEEQYTEIQNATEATDSEMENVRKKADQLAEKIIATQTAVKNDLKNRLEAKLPGYTVIYEDNAGTEAGWVVRGNGQRRIILNGSVDAEILASTVAAHELTHVAEESGYYEDLKESLFEVKYLDDADNAKKNADIENLKEDYAKDGIELTDAQAEKELAAEIAEDIFGRNKAWVDNLIQKKPNIAVRVYNWVKEKAQYFKTLFSEGKQAAQVQKMFANLKNNFAKALNDVAEITDSDTTFEETAIPESETRQEALKRRIEARTKARLAARLMNASDIYREAKDWVNYRRTIDKRMEISGEGDVRVEAPARIMRTLSESIGLPIYEGRKANAEAFAAYDKRTRTYVADPATASDVAATAYAVGEYINDVTNVADPDIDYTTADFLMDYLTTPDERLSEATAKHVNTFRTALAEANPGFLSAFDEARNKMIVYTTSDTAAKLSAFMTNRSQAKKKETLGNRIRDLKISLIDQTFAAEIVDQMTGTHDLRQAASYLPYAKRRTERLIKGTEFVLPDGTRAGGDTFATALDGINRDEEQRFNMYLGYTEAIDRYNLGKNPFTGNGPKIEEMQGFVDDVNNSEDGNRFREAANKLHKVWDRFMMEYVVGEGLLSLEEYNRMKKDHPNYVPLTREGSGSYKFRIAQGNSDKAFYEPIENMIEMVEMFVNKAMQNRFARVFDRLYRENDGLAALAVQLPFAGETVPDKTTLTKQDAEGNDVFWQLAKGELVDEVIPDGGDVMTVYNTDGSRVRYKVYDTALFKLLSGWNPESQAGYLNGLGKVTRMMAYLTTGINPLFIAKNVLRDIPKSINHGTWAYTYFDGLAKWIMTAAEVVKGESEDYKDYAALGGGDWELIRTTTERGEKAYKDALYGSEHNNIFTAIKRGMERIGQVAETTSRFAEYRYGKHDKSTVQGRQDAFMAAMETTVDFQRSGNGVWAKAFKNIVPFFNATLQGNYQAFRQFTDAEKGKVFGEGENAKAIMNGRLAKYVLNNVLTGVMSALAVSLFASDEDKEKYKRLLDSYKHGYIILPWLFDEDAERDFVRLPVAQDMTSKLFYEFGRQIGSGEFADGSFGRDMLHLGFDVLTEGITGARPIWAVFFDVLNNRTWAGSDLVSEYTQSLPTYAQANDDTSHLYRWGALGLDYLRNAAYNLTGMEMFEEGGAFAKLTSPIALEYTTEQLTGWFGQLVMPMLSPNRYTGKYTLGNQLLNGLKAARNAFSVDVDSYNTVDEMYEEAVLKIDQLVASGSRGARFDLNPANTEEENKRALHEAQQAKKADGAYKTAADAISDLWDEYNKIQADENLTGRQKAILGENIKEEMAKAKEEFLSWYLEFEGKYLMNTLVKPKAVAYTEIELLDERYRIAYENGEEYMIRAEETGKYPESMKDFKDKGIEYVVADMPVEIQEAYEDEFEQIYKELYEKAMSDNDYDALDAKARIDLMADVRTEARSKAKSWCLKELEKYND